MKKYSWILALFCVTALLVTSCGGGGGGSSSSNAKKTDVAVTGVSLTPTIRIAPGATYQLNATFTPSNATNKNVTWASDDEDVAIVSASGVVTAIEEGEAKITVTTADGGHTATCTVTVKEGETTEPELIGVKPSSEYIYGNEDHDSTDWVIDVGTVNLTKFATFPNFTAALIASGTGPTAADPNGGTYLEIRFEAGKALDITDFERLNIFVGDWDFDLWVEGTLLTGKDYEPIKRKWNVDPGDGNLNYTWWNGLWFDLRGGEAGLNAVTGIRLFNCGAGAGTFKINRIFLEETWTD